jgi:hypothetical protein
MVARGRAHGREPAYLNRYVVIGAVASGDNQWKGHVRYNGDTFAGSVGCSAWAALQPSVLTGSARQAPFLSAFLGILAQAEAFSR